jgi:hypothetical protein
MPLDGQVAFLHYSIEKLVCGTLFNLFCKVFVHFSTPLKICHFLKAPHAVEKYAVRVPVILQAHKGSPKFNTVLCK